MWSTATCWHRRADRYPPWIVLSAVNVQMHVVRAVVFEQGSYLPFHFGTRAHLSEMTPQRQRLRFQNIGYRCKCLTISFGVMSTIHFLYAILSSVFTVYDMQNSADTVFNTLHQHPEHFCGPNSLFIRYCS